MKPTAEGYFIKPTLLKLQHMQVADNTSDPIATAPPAESGSPSPTYTEEEKAQMLEAYQRDVMERVPTLQEECHLGKVSDFCRISD